MTRLSNKHFWDLQYTRVAESARDGQQGGLTRTLRGSLKRLCGDYIKDYSTYLKWDILFNKHLPHQPGLKVLEVGSAPGIRQVRFRDRFGYIPYGVEYSDSGAELNRQTFIEAGLDPNNVIHADFFSETFQSAYQGKFDLVFSSGFIEHFTDVESVIDKHLALLKPGGYMMITIPRLTGINYPISLFFDPSNVTIHNLNIMDKASFAALFHEEKVQTLYCNYLGTMSFRLFETKDHHGFKYRLLRLCWWLQIGLNLMFRLLFGEKGAESRLFSPYLIYIGRKK